MDQLFALGNVSNRNAILEIARAEISGDRNEHVGRNSESVFGQFTEPPRYLAIKTSTLALVVSWGRAHRKFFRANWAVDVDRIGAFGERD
jgi:hypothetical protein